MMEELYEHIDLYLQGRLSGDELKAFEERLASDPAFEETVKQQFILVQAIKESRKAEMKEYLSRHISQSGMQSSQLRIKRNYNWYYLAAAAVVLVAAGLVFMLNREPSSPVADSRPPIQPVDTPDRYKSAPPSGNVDKNMPLAHTDPDTVRRKVTDGIKTPQEHEREKEEMLAAEQKKFEQEDMQYRDRDDSMTEKDQAKMPVQGYAANDFEQAVIKREEKLGDTVMIATLAPAVKYSVQNQERVGKLKAQKPDKLLKRDTVKVSFDQKTNQYPRNYDTPSNTSIEVIEPYVYTVELWKSPVNFKGYNLTGQNLKLYGISRSDKYSLVEYNGNLYLEYKDNFYKLIRDDRFHEYVKEVDQNTITILKKR